MVTATGRSWSQELFLVLSFLPSFPSPSLLSFFPASLPSFFPCWPWTGFFPWTKLIVQCHYKCAFLTPARNITFSFSPSPLPPWLSALPLLLRKESPGPTWVLLSEDMPPDCFIKQSHPSRRKKWWALRGLFPWRWNQGNPSPGGGCRTTHLTHVTFTATSWGQSWHLLFRLVKPLYDYIDFLRYSQSHAENIARYLLHVLIM